MGIPHNSTMSGEIAKIILVPGDPLRAEFIVKNWPTNVKLVSKVRNIYALTGESEGREVTVMAGGMGTPNVGIYSYELFTQCGVERIICIGSAGAYSERSKLYDAVLAEECWSKPSFGQTQNRDISDTKCPDPELNQVILEVGNKCGTEVVPAKVHLSDVFYSEPGMDSFQEIYAKYGSECVEMESFALFHNAKVLGKRVACLLATPDSFITGEKATVEERQEAFGNMMKVALETAVMMADQVTSCVDG